MIRTRRRLMLAALGLVGAGIAPPVAAAMLTPRQSAGPFYPDQLPLDDDNDLVHVRGQTAAAKGEAADLSGRLLDRNGRPLHGMRIEIWQCDANGRYRHRGDSGRRPIDPGFQGFGHTLTDAEGGYRFLTIRPVPYPGRTPHIHVAVFPPGDEPFVTQLYVADEPRNNGDFLYQRVPDDRRHLVTADFAPAGGADAPLQARWDIVLGLARA